MGAMPGTIRSCTWRGVIAPSFARMTHDPAHEPTNAASEPAAAPGDDHDDGDPGPIGPTLTERWAELRDASPVGLVPILLLVISLVSGAWLLRHPPQRQQTDLVLWTFASQHIDFYNEIRPEWEAERGASFQPMQVHGSAINQRLRSAFWADVNVPDLVEVEVSNTGSFFRGPVDSVGFIDLTPYLELSGVIDRIPAGSLATYSNRGRIFGVPRGVHPVMLAYRADLLEPLLAEHGYTVDDLRTWEDFARIGHEISQIGSEFETQRAMLHLEDAQGWAWEIMYLQAGGQYFTPDGELVIENDLTVETIRRFVPMVAGSSDRRCAMNQGSWGNAFYGALQEGRYLCVICPDWRTRSIQINCPDLAGRMRLMPLPAYEPGGRRTSTWGGTMIGITRACDDPDLAWDLVEALYFDPSQAGAWFRMSNILPPDRAAWDDPAFQEPRPYWDDMVVGQEYIALADAAPPQIPNPFLPFAKAKLGELVAASVAYYRDYGEDGFEDFVRAELAAVTRQIERQMSREPDWDAE